MRPPTLLALIALSFAPAACKRSDPAASARGDALPIVPERPSSAQPPAERPPQIETQSRLRVAYRGAEPASLFAVEGALLALVGERVNDVRQGTLHDSGSLAMGGRLSMARVGGGIAAIGRFPERAYLVVTDHLSRMPRPPVTYRHTASGWWPEQLLPETERHQFSRPFAYNGGRVMVFTPGHGSRLLTYPDKSEALSFSAICGEGKAMVVYHAASSEKVTVLSGWCEEGGAKGTVRFAVAHGDKLEPMSIEGASTDSSKTMIVERVVTSASNESLAVVRGEQGDLLCKIDGATCKPVPTPPPRAAKAPVRLLGLADTGAGLVALSSDLAPAGPSLSTQTASLHRRTTEGWAPVSVDVDGLDAATSKRVKLTGLASHGRALWLSGVIDDDRPGAARDHLLLTDETEARPLHR